MSIGGGLSEAIERGREVGCTALQIFTRNNLRWAAPPLSDEEVARFREAWRASGIGPIVAHANYLINLASSERATARRSLEGLVTDLQRAAALGLRWVILHPGAHLGAGEDAGLRRAAGQASRALEQTSRLDVGLLLETTAGQGTCLGSRFEHLAGLLDAIACPQRMGVCFDTCHAFAAGYDLRTPAAYRATMRQLDHTVGLQRVHAIHLNDAKGDLGSHLDRHAHIGHGRLGLTPFRCILRDRRLRRVPKLLETPKRDDTRDDWDRVNLATLRDLA
jgi:deoxyribonuclease-4